MQIPEQENKQLEVKRRRMDQRKIGQYLRAKRKLKDYTQKDLAEKIGVSDKTVSKWENGDSMPDITLLVELCGILDTNLNELLSGEQLSPDEYSEKAEENMMSLLEKNEAGRKRAWIQSGIGVLVLFFGFWVLGVQNFGEYPWRALGWYFDPIPLLTIVLIVVAGVLCGRVRGGREGVGLVRKLILPVGMLVACIQCVNVLLVTDDATAARVGIGIALLPIGYALIAYIILAVIENRLKQGER